MIETTRVMVDAAVPTSKNIVVVGVCYNNSYYIFAASTIQHITSETKVTPVETSQHIILFKNHPIIFKRSYHFWYCFDPQVKSGFFTKLIVRPGFGACNSKMTCHR